MYSKASIQSPGHFFSTTKQIGERRYGKLTSALGSTGSVPWGREVPVCTLDWGHWSWVSLLRNISQTWGKVVPQPGEQ